jgi:hypothetical protein
MIIINNKIKQKSIPRTGFDNFDDKMSGLPDFHHGGDANVIECIAYQYYYPYYLHV